MKKCCDKKSKNETRVCSLGVSGSMHIFKYWIHHISHEWDVSRKLLEGGYLSVGWSKLADSGLENVTHRFSEPRDFEAVMRERNQTSYDRWSLFEFFAYNYHDTVVVPLPGDKFSIYRVIGRQPMPVWKMLDFSEFELEDGSKIVRSKAGLLIREKSKKIVDLGFVIKVEPVKENISRHEYADGELLERMRSQRTITDTTDLRKGIDKIIDADAPLNLYASVVEKSAAKLLEVLKEQLTPIKFEGLLMLYFHKYGASEVFIPAEIDPDKRDGSDADVIAEFSPWKMSVRVQAKLGDDIDRWVIEQITKEQSYYETIYVPWIISTTDKFSDKAVALAQENKVRLIAGAEFARMLIEAGITDIINLRCRDK
ncbi:MAG: restriction endonuclease [Synergistaceae bacterium]|nr:restriction endonuclease [Synergistaceae bacterium]